MSRPPPSTPQTAPASGEYEIDGVDPWIGRTLGDRYRVIERIGQGGMGTVYVAEHLTLHKLVALKLVHEEAGTSHAQRFVREAMVTSLIDHPNVISAIDFGTFDSGTAFLAMQLVRGPTLGRVLKDEGCLSWVRVADIGAQIADALCAAQAHSIVHRDLKPENVILQHLPDGTELIKLLDFGIAKHARDSLAPPPMQSTQAVTRIGVIIGTLGYMAPEQAVGKRADHRSDLYALGAILWECVVGRRLWSSDDVQTLLAEQLNKPARSAREVSGDASMPDEFDSLVARLLAINPGERPQSPAEVRDALRAMVSAVKQGAMSSATPSLERRVPLLVESQTTTRVQHSPQPPTVAIAGGARAAGMRMELRPLAAPALPSFAMPPAPPPPPAAPPPIGMPSPAPAPPPIGVPAGAAVASTHLPGLARTPRMAAMATTPTLRPLWQRNWVRYGALAALLLTAAGAWLARGALFTGPKPKVQAIVKAAPRATPRPGNLLADPVRDLLHSLVEGVGREERVAAAEALLRHVPVDEVPAYARAMSHLQLAETCAQKKEQLATIRLVDDPRTLPVLVALTQRKPVGCGPKGKEDCLACLREDLDALVKRFETQQMTQPATPPPSAASSPTRGATSEPP